MKVFDWVIILLIGALFAGAYLLLDAIEPTSGLFPEPSDRIAWTKDILTHIGVSISAFVVYLVVFRGPAAMLRTTGAAAILLFLLALGLQIFPRYLLFTGWADSNDLENRFQLLGIADWFSGGLLMLAGLAFVGVAALGLVRRLTAPNPAK